MDLDLMPLDDSAFDPQKEVLKEANYQEEDDLFSTEEPIQLYLRDINQSRLLDAKDEFLLALMVQARDYLQKFTTAEMQVDAGRSIRPFAGDEENKTLVKAAWCCRT